ncbi:MAG: FmdB family zinc ribbon protein [Ktedonobacterales bacterium]
MPTYDYACDTCGNRFEQWQKFTDEPTKICPVCGAAVHRVIYPVGLVFKGGGFYKTDNRPTAVTESSAKPSATPAAGGPAANGKSAGGKSAGDKPSGSGSNGKSSDGDGSAAKNDTAASGGSAPAASAAAKSE